MEVSGVSSAGVRGEVDRKSATSVDYNSFLQLLVAQLKNQDPTNPTEGTEFLSQLASFSMVEQGVQTNSKLDSLIRSSLLDQADAVIGRFATSADGGTSGVIRRVALDGQSLVAELDNGGSVRIGDGVRIS